MDAKKMEVEAKVRRFLHHRNWFHDRKTEKVAMMDRNECRYLIGGVRVVMNPCIDAGWVITSWEKEDGSSVMEAFPDTQSVVLKPGWRKRKFDRAHGSKYNPIVID